jgi:hypothetical protein
MTDLPAAGNQHGSLEWVCSEHGKLNADDVTVFRTSEATRRFCSKCLLRLLGEAASRLMVPVHEAKLERTS